MDETNEWMNGDMRTDMVQIETRVADMDISPP